MQSIEHRSIIVINLQLGSLFLHLTSNLVAGFSEGVVGFWDSNGVVVVATETIELMFFEQQQDTAYHIARLPRISTIRQSQIAPKVDIVLGGGGSAI